MLESLDVEKITDIQVGTFVLDGKEHTSIDFRTKKPRISALSVILMSKRVYKHICKKCETVFYVESLKLINACRCPRCCERGVYVDEHKLQ